MLEHYPNPPKVGKTMAQDPQKAIVLHGSDVSELHVVGGFGTALVYDRLRSSNNTVIDSR